MPIRRSPNDARHPRPQLVAIPRNRRSRSIGTAGRNQSERPVAITRCAQPEIVFVLFQDQERVEENREEFFSGERRRFSHYYQLDKRTPVYSFDDELAAMIRLCQSDLGWLMSKENLRKLLGQNTQKKKTSPDANGMQTSELTETIERLGVPPKPFTEENAVFTPGIAFLAMSKAAPPLVA